MKPTIIALNSIPAFADFSNTLKVPMWPANNYSDAVNEYFKHRKDVTEDIAYYLMERLNGKTTDGLILEGPTGSGKSSTLRQFLAQLNYPVHSETGTGNTEKEVLLGRLDPLEGMLVFKDGPLTTAARHGHAFIFEERDCAPADVNKGLNSILDGYDIHLAESGDGERVALGKNFFFAATQNTSGGNDFSGESPAAQLQDSSSEDRFEKIYVGYMEEEDEIHVIQAQMGNNLPYEIIEKSVQAANKIRSVYVGNRITKPNEELNANQQLHRCSLAISTRGLLRFNRKMIQYGNSNLTAEEMIEKVVDKAFSLDKVTETDQQFIMEIFKSTMLS